MGPAVPAGALWQGPSLLTRGGDSLTRRRLLAGAGAGLAGLGIAPGQAADALTFRIHDDRPGHRISPFVYGGNEIGVMDGGRPSAVLDREAGVAFRRLGGNLMTGYNWVTNASHAGKNYRHGNGPYLLEALQVPKPDWSRPAVVIETMHDASLAMGAQSVVTVPLAGYVAADFGSVVAERDAAPSARFLPVRWEGQTPAGAEPDRTVADIPHLIARLLARYGDAGSARGIHAYALDNEPGIWFETHPRLMPRRIAIRTFIERSIKAAKVIKTLDPKAKVFGPCSWGATEMVSFQGAPDWSTFRGYGSFLAAYLAAFREASGREGKRLLDVLDVHWYPFSRRGSLYRTEDAALDPALLDAPRALSEAGYREDSWVSNALRASGPDDLTLPILPSLKRLIDKRFPGTELAVMEFNYGGAGRLAAGLTLADALGRYGAGDVGYATHWGSLDGWLKEAYRLFRAPDAAGRTFSGRYLPVDGTPSDVPAYAARDDAGLHLVVVNKRTQPVTIDLVLASGRSIRAGSTMGFDAERPSVTAIGGPEEARRLVVPGRAARRYVLT